MTDLPGQPPGEVTDASAQIDGRRSRGDVEGFNHAVGLFFVISLGPREPARVRDAQHGSYLAFLDQLADAKGTPGQPRFGGRLAIRLGLARHDLRATIRQSQRGDAQQQENTCLAAASCPSVHWDG